MTVKFMETVVLLQTRREPESVAKENDFCLDSIPLGLKLVRPRRLEEEAVRIFDMLVKYHGSAHISSANLKLVRPRRLEEEAVRIFDMLVKYHGSA